MVPKWRACSVAATSRCGRRSDEHWSACGRCWACPPKRRDDLTPENDTERGECIDQFWDQLTQGQADVAGDRDPADAATIRYLHAFDDRPGPDPTFRHRLREELMNADAIPVSSQPSLLPYTNRRASQPQWIAPQTLPQASRRWGLAPFATAALLVLTLVGGFLASGSGRFGRQAMAPLLLPAINATLATSLGSEPTAE